MADFTNMAPILVGVGVVAFLFAKLTTNGMEDGGHLAGPNPSLNPVPHRDTQYGNAVGNTGPDTLARSLHLSGGTHPAYGNSSPNITPDNYKKDYPALPPGIKKKISGAEIRI